MSQRLYDGEIAVIVAALKRSALTFNSLLGMLDFSHKDDEDKILDALDAAGGIDDEEDDGA